MGKAHYIHINFSEVVEFVYDMNLNSLGVNPPLTPPVEGKSVGLSQEGRKRNRRRKFFVWVKVMDFDRALIWTWYHTSNYQRQFLQRQRNI
ncbi:hypothetical protein [Okeania sp. SIO1I7]|uniref:hypothetical protein n=1 Tax=Okeania sp. SIO1I7 TaxID=2607772 RepID=UPI0013F706F0|nr:hypothetical protein [Okeania sp. SIO1I7]NET24850.1 hypothetical protein [Okeania sp. SIO1I7]